MAMQFNWRKNDDGTMTYGQYHITKSSGRYILWDISKIPAERLFRGSLSDCKATAQAHADATTGEVLAAQDAAVRTPDADLDRSEVEDQPEEMVEQLVSSDGTVLFEKDERGRWQDVGEDIGQIRQRVDRAEGIEEAEICPDPTENAPAADVENPSQTATAPVDAPSADTTTATSTAPVSNVQDKVTELFRRHGTNCPKWFEWAELLEAVDLTPADVTPQIIRRATQVVVDETKTVINHKLNGRSDVLENLKDGTPFRLGQNIGRLLSCNACDARVKIEIGGKVQTLLWSPLTQVEVITEREFAGQDTSDNNDEDEELVEVTVMQVKEAEARQMFKALGLPKVDDWNPKKVVARLNAAVDFQDKSANLEGDDLTLYKAITDSLGEGEKIELWKEEDVAVAVEAVEPEASEAPKATKKVKKTVTKKEAKATTETKRKPGRPAKASANGKPKTEKPKKESDSNFDSALRKKIPGKNGLGVCQTIEACLKDASKKAPVTKEEILAALNKNFPTREAGSMKNSVNTHVSQLVKGRFKEKGKIVLTNEKGGFWMQ